MKHPYPPPPEPPKRGVATALERIASALERIAAGEERGVSALTRDDRRERP